MVNIINSNVKVIVTHHLLKHYQILQKELYIM